MAEGSDGKSQASSAAMTSQMLLEEILPQNSG